MKHEQKYSIFDDSASMNTKKLRFKRIHVTQQHASLCTKRREGVFRLRLKKYKFRPQQSNLYMDEKVKIYYKVWTVIYSIVQSSITVFSTKLIQMFLSSIQAGLKRSFSSFRNVFRIINFRHHHHANKQTV
jgi:predicted AlkP superfamily phosphohydrolase/phosphomutase